VTGTAFPDLFAPPQEIPEGVQSVPFEPDGSILAVERLIGLLGDGKAPTIGKIQLTGSIRQTHSRTATVTRVPIEDGSFIADHRQRDPVELEMDCVISSVAQTFDSAPFDGAADALIQGLGSLDRVVDQASGFEGVDVQAAQREMARQNAYDTLLEMERSNEPFTVATKLAIYPGMLFTRLTILRDAETGDALRFTASMIQIQIAYQTSIVVRPQRVDRAVVPPARTETVTPEPTQTGKKEKQSVTDGVLEQIFERIGDGP
jgi:hypothetical protein